MADQHLDDELVTVRFSTPVEGVDLDDGDTFLASRHRVPAFSMRQDGSETIFFDDTGQVLAQWQTGVIEEIIWPGNSSLLVTGGWLRPGSHEWRRARREQYPRAGQRWEAAEDEQLAAEVEAGLSVSEMATAHGRAPGGIRARLIHQLLSDRGPAAKPADAARTEPADVEQSNGQTPNTESDDAEPPTRRRRPSRRRAE